MYLKISKNNKTGRTYLAISESYRDKVTKKSKSRTIQSIGYLDELLKQFDDPIAHFSQVVEDMKNIQKSELEKIKFEILTDTKLETGTNNRKNFGYAAFSFIYHILEIDKFLINRQRSTMIEANTNNIMKLLVYSRLLNPGSKKQAFENKDMFFERANYSLDDIYRALTFFNQRKLR